MNTEIRVLVSDANSTTEINTETYDNGGYFAVSFYLIEPGEYNVTFHCDGYTNAKTTLTINPVEVTLKLEGAIDATYGNKTTLTVSATVPNGADDRPLDEGNISFYLNDVLNQTIELNNDGKAVLEITITCK